MSRRGGPALFESDSDSDSPDSDFWRRTAVTPHDRTKRPGSGGLAGRSGSRPTSSERRRLQFRDGSSTDSDNDIGARTRDVVSRPSARSSASRTSPNIVGDVSPLVRRPAIRKRPTSAKKKTARQKELDKKDEEIELMKKRMQSMERARISNDLIKEKDIRQGRKAVSSLKKVSKSKDQRIKDLELENSVLRKTVDKMNGELEKAHDEEKVKTKSQHNGGMTDYKYRPQPIVEVLVDEDIVEFGAHNTREYYNPGVKGYASAAHPRSKKHTQSRHLDTRHYDDEESPFVVLPLWTHIGDSVIYNREFAWFSRKGGGYEKSVKHKQDVYPILPEDSAWTPQRKIEMLQADIEYHRELIKQERSLGKMPLTLVHAYEDFEREVRDLFTQVSALEKQATDDERQSGYRHGQRARSRSPDRTPPPRSREEGFGPPEPREMSAWRSSLSRLQRSVQRLLRDRDALGQAEREMEQLRQALRAAEARLSVRRIDRSLQTDSEAVLEGLYDDILRMVITEVAADSRQQDTTDIKHIPLSIARFLSPKAKGAAGSLRNPRLLSREFGKIYVAKSKADQADDREGNTRQSFPEFLYDYFIHQYGMQKMAEANLIHFIWSVNSAALERDDAVLFQSMVSGAYPPGLCDYYMHCMKHQDGVKGGIQLSVEDAPFVSADRVDALFGYALKGLSPQEQHVIDQKLEAISATPTDEQVKKHPLLKKHKLVPLWGAFIILNDEWLAEKNRLKVRLDRFFKENDKDGNGSLSLDEFRELVNAIDSKFSKRRAVAAFRQALDQAGTMGMNKDGFVSFGTRYGLGSSFKMDLK